MGFFEKTARAETQTKVQRIHIIGGPGSGKSTLARMLGQRMRVPVYELDKIAFEGKDFVERPLDVRLREAHEIARQRQWVSEGIFVDWIDELVCNADVILWLDTVPWGDAMWRIALRFAQSSWREVGRQHGFNKFLRVRDYRRNLGQLWGVMFTSHAYYNDASPSPNGDSRHVTRVQTENYLARYMDKVIHLQNREAIAELVGSITPLSLEERGWS